MGGAGLAGLTLTGFTNPFFAPRRVFANDFGTAWKFGVMADTQWEAPAWLYGEPASCATTIIDALNDQFIQHGCKFVVQVGDFVDDEEDENGERTLPTRQAHCQALYDAGIGFFPVRGNHELTAQAAQEIVDLFPQTRGQGDNLSEAENFASPVIGASSEFPNGVLEGLSYMFDVNNVRCVFIDQFVRLDGSNYNQQDTAKYEYTNNTLDQMDWIDSVLSGTGSDQHTFMFAHKNLIGGKHKDSLFGDKITSNPTQRDRFITSMYENGARYFMSGHDHMHCNSIITTADGTASVNQIICSSNSHKFYTPKPGDDGREIPVDQELYSVGYYIVTVDGPLVTVDFYSSNTSKKYGSKMTKPPESFTFYHRDTFGYGLNGQEFIIGQGEDYTAIADSYDGTAMKILSGVNGNGETDYLERDLSKAIYTGWQDSSGVNGATGKILALWGLEDNLSLYSSEDPSTIYMPNSDESMDTDTYTLSMTYNPRRVRRSKLARGKFGIAAKDSDGNWVNAVDLNSEGASEFVYGPWKSSYKIGTWGADPSTATVWAVINHCGEFVTKFL
nr:metallophosphoesterase [uncultured Desulfobacter sp.]